MREGEYVYVYLIADIDGYRSGGQQWAGK